MPSEEEEAKILLCGALVNYHSGEAACAAAEAAVEMVNLVRITIPDLDGDEKIYYDSVERHAEKIMDHARAIMEAANEFQGVVE